MLALPHLLTCRAAVLRPLHLATLTGRLATLLKHMRQMNPSPLPLNSRQPTPSQSAVFLLALVARLTLLGTSGRSIAACLRVAMVQATPCLFAVCLASASSHVDGG